MTRPVAFGDIFDLQRRAVPVDLDHQYREVGVRSFGRGLFVKEPVSGLQLGSKRVFFIHRGDLVISNVFGWEGAVAMAEEQHHGLIGSHRFMTWTPISGIDVRYVQQFLLSDTGLQLLREASPGSAGRNRTLSVKNLLRIPIPLRPLTDQRRIADHLDAIAMSQPPGAPSRPQWGKRKHAVHDQIVQQAGGDMTRLSEILSSRAGDPVQPEKEYRISGVYSFGRGLLDRGTLSGTETKYASFTELHDDDIVYSKLGAFENAVARVTGRYVGSVVSPEFPVFSLCADVHPEYLIAALTTRNFAGVMSTASAGVGARQRRVSPSVFLDFQVRLPTLHEQQRVVEKLRLLNRAGRLKARGHDLHLALLPAARNELFSSRQ